MNLLKNIYIDKPWHWGNFGLSNYANITIEFMEKYPNKPWCWGIYGLSSNRIISLEFIEKYIDKPWDWYCVSSNSNITLEFVEKYNNKPWDLYWLSSEYNHYDKEYEIEIVKYYKEKHKEKYRNVLEEYMCVCFDPDNMKFMMLLGVYPEYIKERWSGL